MMRRCSVCASPAPNALCQACRTLLVKPDFSCLNCGKPLPNDDSDTCGECRTSQPAFDAVIYASLYQYPIDHWVHQLKFGGQLTAAQIMAEALIPYLESTDVNTPIIPMPLHPSRLRIRGYNQAAIIAKIIAEKQNRRLLQNALIRTKATKMQAELREKQRQANVAGAFKCPEKLNHETVLLIDDVLTTGQTLRSAAKTLKKAGVKTVIAAVFSRSKG
ncbi:ComF family protein [Marinicella rhabdoformis]|uniref:ComF family protein n=1 Tax=Marinicella rhabdoformis TaxID=2580566 RepID=UPI0012AEDB9D|nr:ComF family protein [Marinicella rhabdoformis]